MTTLSAFPRLVLLLGLLALPACVPGGTVDRELNKGLGKILGVRSPEEQLYCQAVQQQSLAKQPPEIPPSCDDILKAAKAQEVKP